MNRALAFAYGLICYLMFLGVFAYAAGFVGNLVVPTSIDSGPEGPLGTALLVNTLLLAAFAIQHTGMARRGFKRWWTRYVPAPVERATYVLATNLCFIVLFLLWQPMTATVWKVEGAGATILQAVFVIGWCGVVVSTFMIDHFDLFGMRQVWFYFHKKTYPEIGFRVEGFYKYVRHPIQTCFLVAFWATPHMTVGHLLFAVVTTGYIVIAVKFFEERDLVHAFGERYRRYQEQVSMLLPTRKARP